MKSDFAQPVNVCLLAWIIEQDLKRQTKYFLTHEYYVDYS